jgi:hypothetical protein
MSQGRPRPARRFARDCAVHGHTLELVARWFGRRRYLVCSGCAFKRRVVRYREP